MKSKKIKLKFVDKIKIFDIMRLIKGRIIKMTFEEYRKLCERRKEITLIGAHSHPDLYKELKEVDKKINKVNNGCYMPQIDVTDLMNSIYMWGKTNHIEMIFGIVDGFSDIINIVIGATGKSYRIYFDSKTNKIETEFLKQAFLNSPEIEQLINKYPSLVEVVWDLVKKELQKSKLKEISLIDKMIKEKTKERENYLDEQKRQKMIDILSYDIANEKLKRKEIEKTLEDF